MRWMLVGGFVAAALFGQTFEVASVKSVAADAKPAFGGMRGGPGTTDPGRITYQQVTLRRLLMDAYGVRDFQVAGPGWLDSEAFEIVAKLAPGASKEQLKTMLQNLLVERFGLELHHESRAMPVYELTIARGGPKIEGSTSAAIPLAAGVPRPRLVTDKNGLRVLPPGREGAMTVVTASGQVTVSARHQELSWLTASLEQYLGRFVIDKTGLIAAYDFAMTFLPPAAQVSPSEAGGDPAPNVFTAVQEYLGLKLEEKKGAVDVLVVDHAEREPTRN